MTAQEALAAELECERTGTTRYQLALEIQRLRNHIEQCVPIVRSAAWAADNGGKMPAVHRRRLNAVAERLTNVLQSSPFARG